MISCEDNSDYQNEFFGNKAVVEIEKYKMNFSHERDKIGADFDFAAGSSLHFHEKDKRGNLIFYSITDRGPNFPYKKDDGMTLISFSPEFNPTIVKFMVTPDRHLRWLDSLHIYHGSEKVIGFPQDNFLGESYMDAAFNRITNDKFGLDTESIAIDATGNFWIGDEYGPSLNHLDQNGQIINRYLPGKGLPEIFKRARANRGFEAVTVAPNGKVYAILEGNIKYAKAIKDQDKILLMLELDPVSKITKLYAYPWDKSIYNSPDTMKISDMAAIDNNHFLVVEQGEDKNGKNRNSIYQIELNNATDLSHANIEDGVDISQIKMIAKRELLNMHDYGWRYEKLEGLTVIDDATIAVTNDSDFDLNFIEVNEKRGVIKPIFSEVNTGTNLWIIKLKESLRPRPN